MTTETLTAIADTMTALGINYGLMEYNVKPIEYPYFIGEYEESTPTTEDGLMESTVTLTGYCRTAYADLEAAKQKIMNAFDPISGMSVYSAGKVAGVILYENAQPIPTWDEELKKMQISLHVNEWRV